MLRKIIYFNILILLYKICALSIKNWEKLTLNFDLYACLFAPLPKFILRPGEPPQKNDSTIAEALLSTIRK